MAVRAWNLVVLAALTSTSTRSARILLDYFQSFSFSYCQRLAAYQQSEYGSQDVAHMDISRAYASIKLWLLLTQKVSNGSEENLKQQKSSDEGDSSRKVWNELWPPFESVVVAVEAETQNGNFSVRGNLESTISSDQ